MRNKAVGLFMVSCFFVVLFTGIQEVSRADTDKDIDILIARMKAEYIAKDFSHAHEYLTSQAADGSWPDIDYNNRSVNWDPQKHLDRLAVMAIGYSNGKSVDHGSPSMLPALSKGLTFWYRRRPKSDSWWSNTIGQQLALEQILVLLDGSLPPSIIAEGARFLHDPVQEADLKPTGQNLIWFAGEQFVRGALTRSPQDIVSSIGTIQSTIVITTDEGIQPDLSFHQHGPQLYVGGYGSGFLKDVGRYAKFSYGTKFAFSIDKLKLLSDYLFGGARLMTRGPMLDYGAMGREISRPGGGSEALALLPICDNLSLIRPESKADCDSLEHAIKSNGKFPSFVGNKVFWNSDFAVHQRAGYYASVKLASNRTYGTEKVNNENLKGYWIPFGTNYIARRGDEYVDIFPVWDWAHLPGVTCPKELPEFLSHVDQKDGFSGGVSDGMYGAAAMEINLSAAPSLHGKKAWFFFDQEFVALGAGISSSDDAVVNTTLNQSLHRGEVVSDGKPIPSGEHILNDVLWVLHDGVGYVFPRKDSVFVSIGDKTGSWREINALESDLPVRKDVFELWLSEGTRPSNAEYQYLVVPDTDVSKLSSYVQKMPVEIVANTEFIQAVRQPGLGISEVIFYAPGQIQLHNGLNITVDNSCMMLFEEKGSSGKIGVSAPRGPLDIHVTLSTSRGTKELVFKTHGGPSLGETILQNLVF